MKIGYAPVSTDEQETHLQIDALKKAKMRTHLSGESFKRQS